MLADTSCKASRICANRQELIEDSGGEEQQENRRDDQ